MNPLSIRSYLRDLGLELESIRWFEPRQFQMRKKGLCVCVDAVTENPSYFGDPYENFRRISLIDGIHGYAGAQLAKEFPDRQICMDIYVRLRAAHIRRPNSRKPAASSLKNGLVDVTADNEVRFMGIKELIALGKTDLNSMFAHYCERYGLEHVLRHGPSYISPDSASVEFLEAFAAARPNPSILEIGAGVGICGKAAQRLGIRDLTFVDLNSDVCRYLRDRFDYTVMNVNAFNFSFDRHWDLVLIGIPYELNPWFLEKKGNELASHCDLAAFQSGTPAFFEFEHDWILGKNRIGPWPWLRPEQSLPFHFAEVYENAFDWQYCAIGSNGFLDDVLACMKMRGFGMPELGYISAN
jgi:hypothetical protein